MAHRLLPFRTKATCLRTPIGKNYAKLRDKVTENAPFKVRAKFDGEKLAVDVFAQVGQRGSWEKQSVMGVYDDTEVGPFTVDIYHFPRAPGKEKSAHQTMPAESTATPWELLVPGAGKIVETKAGGRAASAFFAVSKNAATPTAVKARMAISRKDHP